MNALLMMLCLCAAQVEEMQQAAEAEALAERIATSLQEVDEALMEASLAEAVEDQIEQARNAHLAAIRDLDALIRQVKYRRRPSGQGGGGGEGGSSTQQPEPSPPQPSDGSEVPEPGAPMPTGSEPEPTRPEDGASDEASGRDQSARQPPPPPATGSFTRQDTDGRWGLLPPKLAERLLNLHVDEVPARYREHLRRYIRRLQREEQP